MAIRAPRRTIAFATTTAMATGLVTLFGGPAGGETPGPTQEAEAVEAATVIYVSGDFWNTTSTSMDDGDEILEYRPGLALDYIWQNFDHTSTHATPDPVQLDQISVTYAPFAGDFDGDGFDEVVWYAPGSGTDYMWDIDHTVASKDSITSTALGAINNTYLTAVGDFDGDVGDEVFWYAPNSNQTDESYWNFNPGSLTPIGSASPYGIATNEWIPYGGDFSGDGYGDLAWYKKTTGAVWRWDFGPGSGLTKATPDFQLGTATANITEAVTLDRSLDGRTDIMFYTVGTTPDPIWNYDASGTRTIITQANNASYDLTAGNFFQGTSPNDDNSGDDVFLRGGSSYFHNYYVDGGGLTQLQVLSAGGSSALTASGDGPILGE